MTWDDRFSRLVPPILKSTRKVLAVWPFLASNAKQVWGAHRVQVLGLREAV